MISCSVVLLHRPWLRFLRNSRSVRVSPIGEELRTSQPHNLTMRVRVVSQIRPRSGYFLETLKVGFGARQDPDALPVLGPAEERVLCAVVVRLVGGSVLLGAGVDEFK